MQQAGANLVPAATECLWCDVDTSGELCQVDGGGGRGEG